MENKEKELLDKLRDAGKKNYFTLTLSLNGSVIEEIDFSAEKYDPQTLIETRTYFLMSDLKKKVIETYGEKEREIQEKRKKDEMENLWKKHGGSL
jgi:hypothetical protein